MGFSRRYTTEQQDAAVAAYRPREFTAEQVAAAAAAGELVASAGVRLEAFEVPATTVRDWHRGARAARHRQEAAAAVAATAGELASVTEPRLRDLLGLVDHERQVIRELQRSGKDPGARLLRAAKLAREASALELELAKHAPLPPLPVSAQRASTSPAPEAVGDGVGRLLVDHRATVAEPTRVSAREVPADAVPAEDHPELEPVRDLAQRLGLDVGWDARAVAAPLSTRS